MDIYAGSESAEASEDGDTDVPKNADFNQVASLG
jgi:hypothetical protein